MNNSKQKITTFLMFSGNAEEAMNFYTSLFDLWVRRTYRGFPRISG